jgi:hypothetical protein
VPQELEARDEALVVDRDLAVEDQRLRWELANDLDQVGEARRMISPWPADETDVVAGLVREQSPAIHLLLEDDAVPVERATDEGGLHQVDLGEVHFSSVLA